MQKQSEELTAFYQAYLKWLNEGACQDDETFSRGIGLCGCLRMFCFNHGYYGSVIQQELENQFSGAGLSRCYPFGDVINYLKDAENDTCYLNLERIKWVREHAKD